MSMPSAPQIASAMPSTSAWEYPGGNAATQARTRPVDLLPVTLSVFVTSTSHAPQLPVRQLEGISHPMDSATCTHPALRQRNYQPRGSHALSAPELSLRVAQSYGHSDTRAAPDRNFVGKARLKAPREDAFQ